MRARTRIVLLLLVPAAALALLGEPSRPKRTPTNAPGAERGPDDRPPAPNAPAGFVRLGALDLHFEGGLYRGAAFPDGSRFVLVSRHAIHVVDTRTRSVLRSWPVTWPEANVVAVSPDGKEVAYASGVVRVIDADTGKPLREFAPHLGGVSTVAYSPDGRLLLTSGSEADTSRANLLPITPWSSCKVWDAATLTEHPATRGRVVGEHPVWHPNGREFVYHATDRNNPGRAREARVLPLDGRPTEALGLRVAGGGKEYLPRAFSPSGRLLFAQTNDGGAVFDYETRRLRLDLSDDRKSSPPFAGTACIAPDDDTVYTSDGAGTVRVRSLAAGTVREFARYHTPNPELSLSRDVKTLFAHTWNYPFVAWDAATGREIGAPAGHRAAVYAVDVSPDGRFVLTGSADTTARVWDRASGRELRAFTRHASTVACVAFLADNRTALSIDHDGAAKLWDTQTGEESRALALGKWSSVAVAPERGLLAIAFENHIRFWTLPEFGEGEPLAGLNHPLALRFTPDGRALDFLTRYPEDRKPQPPYHAFRRWDLDARREVVQVASWPGIELLSADGNTFVGYVESGGTLKPAAWDRASGREFARFDTEGQAYARALSPDGSRLLVSVTRDAPSWRTNFALYDTRTWEPVGTLEGHTDYVHAVTFSRDGRYLVIGSSDNTAIVWDLARVESLGSVR